ASDWEKTMRAIGLVLLGIAIMALLLTDADAQRRSSAQGSQAAGASRSWCAVHPRHGTENCGYTSLDQCWATIGSEAGWCPHNPFLAPPYGTGYAWSGSKRESCGGFAASETRSPLTASVCKQDEIALRRSLCQP